MSAQKLIICGAGIKSLAHLTKESHAAIKAADLVIYLVNEPLLESWLQTNSKKAMSLNEIYFSFQKRSEAYEAIATKVIEAFNHYNNVCLVFYGHPLLLVDPTQLIIQNAKIFNIDITILPGISSLDCLLADLGIHLKECCFLAEAHYFIKHQIKIDVTQPVILWQIGLIDVISPPLKENITHLKKLQEELLKYYPKNAEIYLYEASIYPHIKPSIVKTTIENLSYCSASNLTTAYLPPL